MNILQALDDQNVFAQFFRGPTWSASRAFLASLFALPMTPEQLAIYSKHTGRLTPPSQPLHEAWLICGRRAGKSFILACVAIFIACFRDWRPHLGPGEIGTVMIIAADRRQARVIMRYCLGLLKSVPMLAQLIDSETRESIALRNRISIEVHTASFRSTRGYTILCALLDEVSVWPTDETSSQPDVEIINAIKPGMATIPDAMLLCASSPHARKGALWSAYAKHYAKENDPILVWQAPTRDMNSTVPQSYIDAHMADDAARASAEYLAKFRSDLEGYVQREVVEACVVNGIRERPWQRDIAYTGFVDLSGGSVDSAALAIAHNDASRDTVILDLLRERKAPHSPEQVIEEFSKTLKEYKIYSVRSDKYAGQFPAEQFRKFGITLVPSDRTKSEIYLDLLPLINSARIELLDHDRCINQLCALERKAARFGAKDIVDHPPNSFDDVINAAAGALVNASLPYGSYDATFGCGREDEEHRSEEARAWRVNGLLGHIYRNA